MEAKLTNGTSQILIAVKSGKAIRFEESKTRPMGRGASGVLRNDPNALKVGIYCDEEVRIKKYAEKYNISEEESRQKVVEYDEGKKNYYLNVFQKQQTTNGQILPL